MFNWFVVYCGVAPLKLIPIVCIVKRRTFPFGKFFGRSFSTCQSHPIALGARVPWKFCFSLGTPECFFCQPASMVLNQRYREIKAIALTAIVEILFLARGKLIIDFYILPVIPLIAMSIAI